MSQFDIGTLDPNTDTGTSLATKLNGKLPALDTTNSGAAEPSYKVAGMYWYDTSGGATAWVLKVYDGTNWVDIGTLNTTAHTWTPAGGGGGITTIEAATDTPSGYGTSGQLLASNGTNAFTFIDQPESLVVRDVTMANRYGFTKNITTSGVTRGGQTNYLHNVVILGDHIYSAGNNTVRKQKLGTLANVDNTTISNARCLVTDGQYLYVGTGNSRTIEKLDPSDLSNQGTYSSAPVDIDAIATGQGNLAFCDDNNTSGNLYYIQSSSMGSLTTKDITVNFANETTAGFIEYYDGSFYFQSYNTVSTNYAVTEYSLFTTTFTNRFVLTSTKPRQLLLTDERYLWVANNTASTVTRIDTRQKTQTSISNIDNAYSMIKFKDKLWVGGSVGNSISAVDTLNMVELADSAFSTFESMASSLCYDGVSGYIVMNGLGGNTNRYQFFQ